MTDFLVLANPSAGGADSTADGSGNEQLARIAERLRAQGTVEIVEIERDADTLTAIERTTPATTCVVVGGDGTLHHVVNAVTGAGGPSRPFGLVPAGTGNDFANGIGLSEDVEEAAAVVASTLPRPLDLVRFGGGPTAVNAAHIGIGVHAAEKATNLKDHLGKLAYPAGAVSAAVGFEPVRVSLAIDGEVILNGAPVSMLGVCNGPLVGGGTALCPPADQGDGLLDVVVMLADSRTALAATTAAMLRQAHLERDDVLHRTARALTVTVHGAGDTVTWNVDGEFHDLPARVDVEVAAGAWRLRA